MLNLRLLNGVTVLIDLSLRLSWQSDCLTACFVTTIMSPPSSPEALYHAIPQVLSDEGDENTVCDIELNGEEECGPTLDPSQALIDPWITWIYFLLGCCILLPWNGTYPLGVILICCGLTIMPVIITAIPFFLSRLTRSSLKATFPSYLTTSFTTAGFVFLAHATAASRRVSRLSLHLQSANISICRRHPRDKPMQHY